MRIEIVGDESIDRQARIYAEYRLFATLSQVVDTKRVQKALLVIRRSEDRGNGHRISCRVAIELDADACVRLSTTAGHPYAAINRIVERLGVTAWPMPLASPSRAGA